MKIKISAMAGTLESSDCLVSVKPGEALEITLESIAQKRYGQHIESLVRDTLAELGVESGVFHINDRGALDYCLQARVASAVKRGGRDKVC